MFVIDFVGVEGSSILIEEDENFQSILEGFGDGVFFFSFKAFSEKREEKKKKMIIDERCVMFYLYFQEESEI